MPFPVKCGACGSEFTLPDAVYRQRIQGKKVDLTCTHCGASIRIDETKAQAPADEKPRPPGAAPPRPAGSAGTPGKPRAFKATMIGVAPEAGKALPDAGKPVLEMPKRDAPPPAPVRQKPPPLQREPLGPPREKPPPPQRNRTMIGLMPSEMGGKPEPKPLMPLTSKRDAPPKPVSVPPGAPAPGVAHVPRFADPGLIPVATMTRSEPAPADPEAGDSPEESLSLEPAALSVELIQDEEISVGASEPQTSAETPFGPPVEIPPAPSPLAPIADAPVAEAAVPQTAASQGGVSGTLVSPTTGPRQLSSQSKRPSKQRKGGGLAVAVVAVALTLGAVVVFVFFPTQAREAGFAARGFVMSKLGKSQAPTRIADTVAQAAAPTQEENAAEPAEPKAEGAAAPGSAEPVAAGASASAGADAPAVPEVEPSPQAAAVDQPAAVAPVAVATESPTPAVVVEAPARSGSTEVPPDVNEPQLHALTELALARARQCHLGGRAVGTSKVFLTFEPDGKVSAARLEGEPVASAPVASCVLTHVRAVVIKAYEGPSFTYETSITLR